MHVVYGHRYLDHIQTIDHPESPARLVAITSALAECGLMGDAAAPAPASKAAAEGVHGKAYVEMLESFGEGPLDPDTFLREQTFEIALLAMGGAVQAAEKAFEGTPSIALVRPPGHHAGPDYGCGFCYLNNAAAAAQRFAAEGRRVAIVDIDAHHGNGTNDIFRDRKDVLYVSAHQWGIFPGTGPASDVGGEGAEGYSVNVPLPPGSGDATFRMAFDEVIEPVLSQFRPELVVVSLGVDAHYMDPLASLALSTPGYVALMERLLGIARRLCAGRLATTLEGGYHLDALAETVAMVAALDTDVKINPRFAEIKDAGCVGRNEVEEAREVQASFWKL